ncbi:MAG: serine hydrolase [Steroidobacteraceae bacterium]|nr:serine hydrolase [Steroidobacteraceae bacterium]
MKLRSLTLWFIASAACAAEPTTVEQRIQRFQSALLPPVLVRGETPALKSLADRMAELKVSGVSIAVIDDGRIDWARGFGVTRVGGPPVTPDTLFQAASISKPVFALAVLKLADAGKLDIDANVNDYLTSWKLPQNDLTRRSPVTLRRLLSHSAGTTVQGFPGYGDDAAIPTTAQILDGTAPANTAAVRVDLLPGSQFRYSGGGYTVAQLALEDVTGQPTPAMMREEVLEPLGMTRSTYEQPLPAARLAEVAMPYDRDGKPIGNPQVHPEMAAAGLWTTPSDLARYAIGVQRAFAGQDKGEGETLIRARTARDMLVPVISAHGVGPAIGGRPERKYFTHGGSNRGYRCVLLAYTDGRGVVLMTNGDNGGALQGEVIRTIAQIYGWPDGAPPERIPAKVEPAILDRLVGAYLLNDGATLVVRRDGDKLVGGFPLQPVNAFYASSETEFFGKASDYVVSFTVVAGKVNGAKFRTGGFERSGPRLDDARSKPLLETAERTARRIAEQKPLPESEPAARKLLAGLASGRPDYDALGKELAELTRRQLPSMHQDLVKLGELRSLVFVSVGPRGEDVFNAEFEKGKQRVEVLLDDAGRIDRAVIQAR